MIDLPLKTTHPVHWESSLRTYLTSVYGEIHNFSSAISSFDRLRHNVAEPALDSSGRDLLYRYYGQLEMLDPRVPIGERGVHVSFTWSSVFDGPEVTQNSVAFEKACLLYNLAAIYSHIGTDAIASNDFKSAYSAFCGAAGIFTFIGQSFVYAPSVECEGKTTQVLSKLMLAQAQYSMCLKVLDSLPDNHGMLSKLYSAASALFTASGDGLSTLLEEHGWGEDSWPSKVEAMSKFLKGLAHYHYALHLDATKQWGEAVGHMQEARSLISNVKVYPTFVEEDKKKLYADRTSSQLKTMEKDNDLIYHQLVPSTVSDVPVKDAAVPTPIEKLYTPENAHKVVGPELFSDVVPLEVHEKASLYSEEKAVLMRAEQEKVDVADQELSSALEYVDLPKAALALRNPEAHDRSSLSEIPQILKEWCVEVSSEPALQFTFRNRRKTILSKLDKVPQGTDTTEIKQSLIEGDMTDKELQSKYHEVEGDIKILAEGPNGSITDAFNFANSVTANTVSLLDIDDNEQDGLQKVLDTVLNGVEKLRKIEKDRKLVFAELKERLLNDDISSQLVLSGDHPKSHEAIFKEEIAKFDPFTSRIAASIQRQDTLLQEVTTHWRKVLSMDSVRQTAARRENIVVKRSVLLKRFQRAYEVWLGLKKATEQGKAFYSDLERMVDRLISRKSSGFDLGFSDLSLGSAPPLPAKPGGKQQSAYDASFYEPQWRPPPPPPKNF